MLSISDASYPRFALNDWDGVTPVILPIGPQTISCIGIASAGVATPFFLFLIALMYYLLVPIWLDNYHSDSSTITSNTLSKSSNMNANSANSCTGICTNEPSDDILMTPSQRGQSPYLISGNSGVMMDDVGASRSSTSSFGRIIYHQPEVPSIDGERISNISDGPSSNSTGMKMRGLMPW